MGAANAVTVDTPDPGNLGIDAALKVSQFSLVWWGGGGGPARSLAGLAWCSPARDDRDTIGTQTKLYLISIQINQSSDINKLVLFQKNVKNE